MGVEPPFYFWIVRVSFADDALLPQEKFVGIGIKADAVTVFVLEEDGAPSLFTEAHEASVPELNEIAVLEMGLVDVIPGHLFFLGIHSVLLYTFFYSVEKCNKGRDDHGGPRQFEYEFSALFIHSPLPLAIRHPVGA